MQALEFWKTVTADDANLLDRLRTLLAESGAAYCVVGGQAVNAYAEPLVSLDLDLVVEGGAIESVVGAARQAGLTVERLHSINLSHPDSDLRIQLQTDPRYGDFPLRAERRRVLGLELPVARLSDLVQGKVWAAQDASRRPSKRLKDLADLARLIEAHPSVRELVPEELRKRIQ